MEKKGKNKVLFLICLILVVTFFIISSYILYYNSTNTPIFLKNECVIQLVDSYYEENSETYTGTLQIYYINPAWDQSSIRDLMFVGGNVSTTDDSDYSVFDFFTTNQSYDGYSSYVNFGAYVLKSQVFEVSLDKNDFKEDMDLKYVDIIMSDGSLYEVDLGDITLIDSGAQDIISNTNSGSVDFDGTIERTYLINQNCIFESFEILPNNEYEEYKIYINDEKVSNVAGIQLKSGDNIKILIDYEYAKIDRKLTNFTTFDKFTFTANNQTIVSYDIVNFSGLSQYITPKDIFKYISEVGDSNE